MRKSRTPRQWTGDDDEVLKKLWMENVPFGEICRRMKRVSGIVRAHARSLRLPRRTVRELAGRNTKIGPDMVRRNGLPLGHLKAWPTNGPCFEDVSLPSSPSFRLAKFIQPEPAHSAGVAHYEVCDG